MLSFVSRGTEGVKKYTFPNCKPVECVFSSDKRASEICMSKNGEMVAICNGVDTQVYNVAENRHVLTIDRPRTMLMAISPNNSYLVTWRQYVVTEEIPENTPNVEYWDINNPQESPVYSYVRKQQGQWAPQWTDDEKICARLCNAEIQFFENNDFSKVASRLQRDKVGGVFIPPGSDPHHVALYVPSVKGAHAFVQLYQYTNLEKSGVIAHRSFMKVDHVNMKWNRNGKYGVIMAQNDVDKSGTSYYGQTLLYFISTKGESNQIVLNKNGPVYSVEWNPTRDEFIVLYGFMPCRATIFNIKCDSVHEFGDNHYNEILFNPQGNMVGLCGFGNLRGKMKFYNVETRKKLSEFDATDTTYFEWAPSGDIFMTGTLSPRLRQDNEFKMWDVTGKVLHHYRVNEGVQLWQLKWVNSGTLLPDPAIPRPATAKEIEAAKPQAYRPPSYRNLPNVQKGVYKPGQDKQQPLSKMAAKNQKKRENRSAATKPEAKPEPTAQQFQAAVVNENEKKLKNLKKKLHQVQKLKEQVAQGKHLEKNQLDKISTENELIAEIAKLEL